MDFLSNNPSLPEILSHLPCEDIQKCRKVNRRFYHIIKTYSRISRKPRGNISIGRENEILKILCEMFPDSENEMTFWLSGTFCSDSIKFIGTQPSKFLEALNYDTDSQLRSGYDEYEEAFISIEYKPQRFQEVLIFLFSNIDIGELRVESEISDSWNSSRKLLDSDYETISDCLSASKARVHQLFLARIAPLYLQCMQEHEWKHICVSLGDTPVSASLILQIPSNVEEFHLNTYCKDATIPDLTGIQTLLKEWDQGKRNFSILSIEGRNDRDSWYTPEQLSEMLSKFPTFKKTSEISDVITAHIKRSIDQTQLFLSLDCLWNSFKFTTKPL